MIGWCPAADGLGGALYFNRRLFVHRGLIALNCRTKPMIVHAVEHFDGRRNCPYYFYR